MGFLIAGQQLLEKSEVDGWREWVVTGLGVGGWVLGIGGYWARG